MHTAILIAQIASVDKRAFELIFGLSSIAIVVAIFAYAVWLLLRNLRRKAQGMGYPGIRSYLKAVPKNDVEKQDAVNLVASGVILCFLGLLFAPLVVFGAVRLYYGCRKMGGVMLTFESLTHHSPGLGRPISLGLQSARQLLWPFNRQ